jgi:GT2 family glycosyltransferase
MVEIVMEKDAVVGGAEQSKRRSLICLTISSFRNDEKIEEILHAVHALPDKIFESIIIVDSFGTNAIPDLIAARKWTNVMYRSYNRNLGSAGNLFERLRLAADAGAEFAYTLNHDGIVDVDTVRLLEDCATHLDRVGAVYPLHYLPGRNQYDLTGRQRLPLPFLGKERTPEDECFNVHWGSSNGALYALEPFRSGLCPWVDLWHCWEDTAYGLLLERHGYRQVVVSRAHFSDNYEYHEYRLLGRKFYLPDKPFWYSYYNTRNMLLIARRDHQSIAYYLVIFVRLMLEIGLITVFKTQKALRCKLLLRGIFDGLRNKAGKREYPHDPPVPQNARKLD